MMRLMARGCRGKKKTIYFTVHAPLDRLRPERHGTPRRGRPARTDPYGWRTWHKTGTDGCFWLLQQRIMQVLTPQFPE